LSNTTYAQKNKSKAKPTATNKIQVKETLKLQSREQLESQRLSIMEEIKRTQNELAVLRQDKKATLSQLQALQSKLSARQSLISNINNEIRYIEENINTANKDVQVLRTQLDTLKEQYAQMVRYTYKNKTSSDLIVFLFSASTFNDAIRRLQYVKQYRGYRADQALKITSASQQLSNKITVLNIEKQKKDFVLQAQEQQKKILESETAEKDKVVSELKGKEKDLIAGLAMKKKAAEDLNRAISAAIQREIDIARKRAMQEKLDQERLRKLKLDQDRKLAQQKKSQEEAAIEKKRREEYERKVALEKQKQEENERKLALAKKQQEENERRLAQEKKDREDRERALAIERKKREEAERKASQMAEAKRIEREKQLAIEKDRQEEEQRKLVAQKQRQEEEQRKLVAQKQRQEEEQRRLTEEKKRQEREQARMTASNYSNPRYIPDLAEKDRYGNVTLNTGSGNNTKNNDSRPTAPANRSNVKTFEKDDYKFSLTPMEQEIANNFESSRGRLPWPVEKGYVVEHFGKNKHPLFNITTENYGIDIKTSRGAKARAVFGGEVASIISIPGAAGQTVLVNHGSYYTVYAKLDKVMVTKGMKLSTKQTIGTVLTDEDGNTQINFQVWKVGANGSSFKVNPELWIAQ
jgi:septal ring factor EnvC (AmiA/AmiB activator)